MVVGAKVCALTDGFLWFVCGNFEVSPKIHLSIRYTYQEGHVNNIHPSKGYIYQHETPVNKMHLSIRCI